jgi:DNA-binding NtrC family response regulator
MSSIEPSATNEVWANTSDLERALKQSIEAMQSAAFALLGAAGSIETALFSSSTRQINFFDEVRRFEISLIERALREVGFNQARASLLLGINKTTLNNKIKQYNIQLDKNRETSNATENITYPEENLSVA